MDELHAHMLHASVLWLAWGGFALGSVFGLILQQTNFCAMGAIADIVTFADHRRMRAWLLAIAVAIAGTQLLSHAGVVDLSLSIYLGPQVNWLGNVVGGLVFGVGMVFAGGCTSRNLVRAGGGDIRAVVVLLMVGISAYMTLSGIFAPARVWLETATAVDLGANGEQSVAALLVALGVAEQGAMNFAVSGVLVGGLLFFCLKDAAFRGSMRLVTGGLGVGLCVVVGWALTGLTYDEFATQVAPPASLSFVRPSGDTLQYLQRFTGDRVPSFAVASVGGALLGAFLGTLMSGKFAVIGFADSSDTLRNLLGGVCMGVGGVVALGCTIGQAVSGVSTLALGSIVTLVAIAAGGVAGMHLLERFALE